MRRLTLILGLSAALLSALLATGPLAAAQPAAKPCSTAGLNFTQTKEGVTYAVAVANLRAKVTSCKEARALAGTVATRILHEAKIPTRINGLTVKVKEPCPGCTPTTQVVAKSGEELVTFVVKGGA
jgi:hypothetical protein